MQLLLRVGQLGHMEVDIDTLLLFSCGATCL